jgi:uncharacterized protein
MVEKYQLTADIFTVPYKDEASILYAPRLGFACIANRDLISLLADLDSIDLAGLNSAQRAALEYLEQKGLFNHAREYNPVAPVQEGFAPNQLTLFPTNQCNLRCIYCYASAGDFKPMVMDWHYATSAFEYLLNSLKERGSKHFSLGFHGGGEPLFPWTFIKRVVNYAEERCAKEGLALAVFSATNGVLSENQLEWITQHFKNLNISFDGLPHVQDYHRPLANGKSSFNFIDRTLRYLDGRGFNYGLRGTVSSYNVRLMKETVEFIGENYKAKSVHLEPLFYCGRCKTSNALSPDMAVFAENFIMCEDVCQSYGINLIYSGSHLDVLHNSFCGVSGNNFSVTPDGHLTTCYEVTDTSDRRSQTFFFGKINEQGTIIIDEEKRQFLIGLTVEKLDYCQDCFAKWHCAGECAAKLEHGDYRGARGNERCQLNRLLIASRLQRLVEGKYPKAAHAAVVPVSKAVG